MFFVFLTEYHKIDMKSSKLYDLLKTHFIVKSFMINQTVRVNKHNNIVYNIIIKWRLLARFSSIYSYFIAKRAGLAKRC